MKNFTWLLESTVWFCIGHHCSRPWLVNFLIHFVARYGQGATKRLYSESVGVRQQVNVIAQETDQFKKWDLENQIKETIRNCPWKHVSSKRSVYLRKKIDYQEAALQKEPFRIQVECYLDAPVAKSIGIDGFSYSIALRYWWLINWKKHGFCIHGGHRSFLRFYQTGRQ